MTKKSSRNSTSSIFRPRTRAGCRFEFHPLLHQFIGNGAEIIIKDLPGIQQVGDHQLVAHICLKRPDLYGKPGNILIALFQESVREGDQVGIRDCRFSSGLMGTKLVARIKKIADPLFVLPEFPVTTILIPLNGR